MEIYFDISMVDNNETSAAPETVVGTNNTDESNKTLNTTVDDSSPSDILGRKSGDGDLTEETEVAGVDDDRDPINNNGTDRDAVEKSSCDAATGGDDRSHGSASDEELGEVDVDRVIGETDDADHDNAGNKDDVDADKEEENENDTEKKKGEGERCICY